MDIVLGVSMAPTSVRMLLVEGENADGVTVEDNNFDIATDDDAATLSAADQVISAILGTREGATQAGHALASTGVTWTDPVDAAALHEALATRKIENVMLVSAFMAAAALAQMVGSTVGDAHTALLFLEPDTATLAVVDSADGSITDVHKELMSGADTVAALAEMVAGLDALEARPQSVFIVGSGVDVAALKPQLEALTSLPVTAAEEPETALAWGAALASASAPLFASSTAALAYAQDPGTGAIDPYAVSPGYLAAPDVPFGTELGEEDLAYSAVPDEEAEAHTAALERARRPRRAPRRRRRAQTPCADRERAGGRHCGRIPVAGSRAGTRNPAECCGLAAATAAEPHRPNPASPGACPGSGERPVTAGQSHVSPRGGGSARKRTDSGSRRPRPWRLRRVPAAPPIPAVAPAPVVVPAPVVAPRAPVLMPLPLPIPALAPPPVQSPPWHAPAPTPVHFPVSQPPVSLPWQPPVSVPVRPQPVHQPNPATPAAHAVAGAGSSDAPQLPERGPAPGFRCICRFRDAGSQRASGSVVPVPGGTGDAGYRRSAGGSACARLWWFSCAGPVVQFAWR